MDCGVHVNTKNLPVLGSDLSKLSNEQIIAWYSKHPNATVRSLVRRIEALLEQHRMALVNVYAQGLASQSFTAQQAIADRIHTETYKEMVNRLSPEELAYIEA